jgi:hypothetical protein
VDPYYSVNLLKNIYYHFLQPAEGEEMWPVSENPRPQAPIMSECLEGLKKQKRRNREA